MKRIICAPSEYIQGQGELKNLYYYATNLGQTNAYAIVDPYILDNYGTDIMDNFKDKSFSIHMHRFNGEACESEIKAIMQYIEEFGSDVVIGIGGGKTIDTAKAVAYYLDVPVIVIPTSTSSDAPCSALSVLYTEEGEFDKYLFLKKNPDLVLVDTSIIANAPVRLLVAGIGDALSTYYEARACHSCNANSIAGGACSLAALAIAKSCRDNLLEDGYKAKFAAETKTVNSALDNIVETTIFLSGIGYESGGLAAAHAINNGFTVLKETHDMLHGEKAAFATIVQLVLENAPEKELCEVVEFCKSMGLPTTLDMIGVTDASKENIMEVAVASCVSDESIHNMPFEVNYEDVYNAIIFADKLGRR